jgi:hypothetical protein
MHRRGGLTTVSTSPVTEKITFRELSSRSGRGCFHVYQRTLGRESQADVAHAAANPRASLSSVPL